MDPNDLRSQSLEELVSQIRATTPQAQAQSVGGLAARCTIELAKSLQVSLSLFDVKKGMVQRLDTLTTELSTASTEASKQTAALVRWTKVLAWMTGAYTVVTGGLLIVAILSLRP